jgi:hypothetical protein
VEDKVSGQVVPICQQERLQLEVVVEEIAQQVELNLVLQVAQDLCFFGIHCPYLLLLQQVARLQQAVYTKLFRSQPSAVRPLLLHPLPLFQFKFSF